MFSIPFQMWHGNAYVYITKHWLSRWFINFDFVYFLLQVLSAIGETTLLLLRTNKWTHLSKLKYRKILCTNLNTRNFIISLPFHACVSSIVNKYYNSWFTVWYRSIYSPCENYVYTTWHYDWQFLNVYLSWLIFTCHIIELRAKFVKCYLSLWQTNQKFLPVATKFCLTLTATDKVSHILYIYVIYSVYNVSNVCLEL